MARQNIDGERKALLRRVADGFRFEGLVPRSLWQDRAREKGVLIVTQRALLGASLHVQSLEGQFPPIGAVIPAALLKGRSGIEYSGDAMDAHLYTIKAQRSQERQALKTLTALKAAIL